MMKKIRKYLKDNSKEGKLRRVRNFEIAQRNFIKYLAGENITEDGEEAEDLTEGNNNGNKQRD